MGRADRQQREMKWKKQVQPCALYQIDRALKVAYFLEKLIFSQKEDALSGEKGSPQGRSLYMLHQTARTLRP